jgi:hypothetical protein
VKNDQYGDELMTDASDRTKWILGQSKPSGSSTPSVSSPAYDPIAARRERFRHGGLHTDDEEWAVRLCDEGFPLMQVAYFMEVNPGRISRLLKLKHEADQEAASQLKVGKACFKEL